MQYEYDYERSLPDRARGAAPTNKAAPPRWNIVDELWRPDTRPCNDYRHFRSNLLPSCRQGNCKWHPIGSALTIFIKSLTNLFEKYFHVQVLVLPHRIIHYPGMALDRASFSAGRNLPYSLGLTSSEIRSRSVRVGQE